MHVYRSQISLEFDRFIRLKFRAHGLPFGAIHPNMRALSVQNGGVYMLVMLYVNGMIVNNLHQVECTTEKLKDALNIVNLRFFYYFFMIVFLRSQERAFIYANRSKFPEEVLDRRKQSYLLPDGK